MGADERQPGFGAAYLVAALGVLVLGAYTAFEPFGRDQGIHSTIAYAWGEGLTTYRDVFNIKPPMTTAMHRLSQVLFGHDMQAIRYLDWVIFFATTLGLVRILQKLGRSAAEAGAAGLGLSVIYYSMTYWEHAQTDGWAAFSVVPSLLCLIAGWERAGRARALWMLLGGAVLGLGVGFKYTIMAAGLLVFAPVLSQGAARFRWSDLGFYVLGGALVLGAIVAVLLSGGALEPFLEIQNYIRGYIAYGAGRSDFLWDLIVMVGPAPVNIWIILGGFLLWLAALMRGETLFFYVIAIWGVTGWLSGFVQAKGFAYHFLPMMPAYAVFWGLCIGALASALRRRLGSAALASAFMIAGLAWVISTTPIWPRMAGHLRLLQANATIQEHHAIHPMPVDFDIAATEDFAALLATHRAPGDSLFVWGYETMIYFLAEEPPRYRYPFAWPFVVDFHDGRYTPDLMARLAANPPRHVVIQNSDATPWVTGRPESSAEFLALFPELSSFFAAHYTPVAETEKFTLLERQ